MIMTVQMSKILFLLACKLKYGNQKHYKTIQNKIWRILLLEVGTNILPKAQRNNFFQPLTAQHKTGNFIFIFSEAQRQL